MKLKHELDSGIGFLARSAAGGKLSRRAAIAGGTAFAAGAALPFAAYAQRAESRRPLFRRVPTQFIAALGARDATSGHNAESWGLWRHDPGPRGVRLSRYEQLMTADGTAPAGWKFDRTDWWLEENGLIMEQPEFPVGAGTFMVTGDREVVSVLTIHPADADGSQRWELADGATLYDVTHLRCRSARYTPATGVGSCTPASAEQREFPVVPGGVMPSIEGCNKQDYAVLFLIGVAA